MRKSIGKTTTMRMLTTLLPIDAGTPSVAGLDVARQPRQARSRIGYVSQLGGADELATGRVRLYVEDGGATLPHLLQVLDGGRVAIRSVQLSEPTMDDVFVRRTGRRLCDAGEAAEGRAAA